MKDKRVDGVRKRASANLDVKKVSSKVLIEENV